MLNIIFPLTDKSVSTAPDLGASAFHFAVPKLSFIVRLVRPSHFSFALHIVEFEIAFIKPARVSEVIPADSMELAIYEITFIVAAFKFKLAFSRLLAFHKVAGKLDLIIIPGFCSEAMLLIVLPLTLIHGPVRVDKDAHTIRLSVGPLTLVDVSVCVRHPALAVELLVLRHSLIS